MRDTPEDRAIDDAVLLQGWAQGDRAAGTALLERYYASVSRFFHNKAPAMAQEDLIHETFLACAAHAAQFRGESRFRTFLFGIAHIVLVSYLRSVGRRSAWMDPTAALEETVAVDLGPSPVATAVQHEEQRLLLEALRRIPLIYQVALELHYWEELTVTEISEATGVPLGTAKTRLRDGRARLEAQLRLLASSPEALRSTLDNLERWAGRVRAHITPEAGADRRRPEV